MRFNSYVGKVRPTTIGAYGKVSGDSNAYDGKNKEIKQDKIELYNKNNEKILETEIETMKTIYVFNMKISPFQTACEKLSKILVQEYNKDKKTIFKKMVPEYIETISITEFSNHLEFIFEDEYYKYYTIDDLRYFIHHLEFKNIEIQKNALALKDYKIPIIFAPKTKEGQQLLENRVNEHLKYNKIQNQNLTDKEIWASVLTMHFSEQAQEITIFNEYFLNKNGELLYCIYNDYQGHTFSIKAQEKYKELINKLNQFLFNEVQQFEKIKIKQFEEDDKIKSSLNN
ncbi:hypothetical protein LJC10_06350 [Selenomonadales bacterium OttesenSCG-928-I06]|nr:hypothetical protein [Selenomonadales bacterium OttesenSCG-928-I06]